MLTIVPGILLGVVRTTLWKSATETTCALVGEVELELGPESA